MTSIDPSMASTQSGRILAYMICRVGQPSTKKELRDSLHIEQISSRIGELREEGWDIRGASDGMGIGRDGTQEYVLASIHRADPRIKVVGLKITQDFGRPVNIVAHKKMGEGMSQSFSDADIRTLVRDLKSAYEKWYDIHKHHLVGPDGARDDRVDAIDYLLDDIEPEPVDESISIDELIAGIGV